MTTVIIIAAIIVSSLCLYAVWWKHAHAYGSREWTKFYRRVAPYLSGSTLNPNYDHLAWITPHGELFCRGRRFVIDSFTLESASVVDRYTITALRFKGGDADDEKNYDIAKVDGYISHFKFFI